MIATTSTYTTLFYHYYHRYYYNSNFDASMSAETMYIGDCKSYKRGGFCFDRKGEVSARDTSDEMVRGQLRRYPEKF